MLVGYFYFSGYKLISEKLIDKHVRILVGLDIDTRITKYIREIDLLADYNKSRSQLKDDYYNHFVKLFNETDFLDSQPKLESFKLFYNKIKSGTLEIRKTDEPCHAKMYIFDYREEINEGGEDPGSVITGSSNLSYEGLAGRVEINARFNDNGTRSFTAPINYISVYLKNIFLFLRQKIFSPHTTLQMVSSLI